MLKKFTVYSLAVALLFGLAAVASAAQNVANTTQKGSLLIFPKIEVFTAYENGTDPGDSDFWVDTLIFIANDYPQEVWVKCYWVNEDQEVQDFMFRLTNNQPIVFWAGSGTDWFLGNPVTVPPFEGVGELKCWAVNAAGDQQISFNHLYGNAWLIGEYAETAYNAWSFTARNVAINQPVGTGGELVLSGANGAYDACPQYLLVNFIPAYFMVGEADFRPDLTLVPCKQDLRQDRTPTYTKAKFDIWNQNETKFTGAYQCIKCWYEGYLDEIGTNGGFGGEKFTWWTLKTFAARFRVQGVASTVCSPAAAASPLVGLMAYGFDPRDALDVPLLDPPIKTAPMIPWLAYEPHGAGATGTGFVKWDPQGGSPEAPGR